MSSSARNRATSQDEHPSTSNRRNGPAPLPLIPLPPSSASSFRQLHQSNHPHSSSSLSLSLSSSPSARSLSPPPPSLPPAPHSLVLPTLSLPSRFPVISPVPRGSTASFLHRERQLSLSTHYANVINARPTIDTRNHRHFAMKATREHNQKSAKIKQQKLKVLREENEKIVRRLVTTDVAIDTLHRNSNIHNPHNQNRASNAPIRNQFTQRRKLEQSRIEKENLLMASRIIHSKATVPQSNELRAFALQHEKNLINLSKYSHAQQAAMQLTQRQYAEYQHYLYQMALQQRSGSGEVGGERSHRASNSSLHYSFGGREEERGGEREREGEGRERAQRSPRRLSSSPPRPPFHSNNAQREERGTHPSASHVPVPHDEKEKEGKQEEDSYANDSYEELAEEIKEDANSRPFPLPSVSQSPSSPSSPRSSPPVILQSTVHAPIFQINKKSNSVTSPLTSFQPGFLYFSLVRSASSSSALSSPCYLSSSSTSLSLLSSLNGDSLISQPTRFRHIPITPSQGAGCLFNLADEEGRYVSVNASGALRLSFSLDNTLYATHAAHSLPDDVYSSVWAMYETSGGRAERSRRNIEEWEGREMMIVSVVFGSKIAAVERSDEREGKKKKKGTFTRGKGEEDEGEQRENQYRISAVPLEQIPAAALWRVAYSPPLQ